MCDAAGRAATDEHNGARMTSQAQLSVVQLRLSLASLVLRIETSAAPLNPRIESLPRPPSNSQAPTLERFLAMAADLQRTVDSVKRRVPIRSEAADAAQPARMPRPDRPRVT
jgi:hypothetical protein